LSGCLVLTRSAPGQLTQPGFDTTTLRRKDPLHRVTAAGREPTPGPVHPDPDEVLEVQRSAHLARMRELNRRKAAGDLADALICDYALFHLEAHLRLAGADRGPAGRAGAGRHRADPCRRYAGPASRPSCARSDRVAWQAA
jgi:hypothetical protein